MSTSIVYDVTNENDDKKLLLCYSTDRSWKLFECNRTHPFADQSRSSLNSEVLSDASFLGECIPLFPAVLSHGEY